MSRILALVLLLAAVLWLLPVGASAQEERFLLTFAGDCTFGTDQPIYGQEGSFVQLVGEDTDYPFRNVERFFLEDDFTMVNLEGVLLDEGYSGKTGFAFRGPTDYVRILSEHGVQTVTLANNHTMDFGIKGYESTKEALTRAEVAFAGEGAPTVFTTDRGLKIGLLAASLTVGMQDKYAKELLEKLEDQIALLREQGAELIVYALHWGGEGYYHPIADQVTFAHQLIDAGVDILYGTHPHVLQSVEEYHGGIIYYSLGNFSFGGNHWPVDCDSAVLQQEVIRSGDGEVRLGQLHIIPVSITSTGTSQNNFQPTPYEPGTEGYDRVLSKLDGSWPQVRTG